MNDQQVTVSNSDVVDRLARLRTLLPLMATDLAVARRRASALQAENERLSDRISELESRLSEPRRSSREPASRRRRSPHPTPQ